MLAVEHVSGIRWHPMRTPRTSRVLFAAHQGATHRRLSSALRQMGLSITEVGDGNALLRHLERRSATRDYLVLIVTEWLPQHGGLEVLERLQTPLPTIFLADTFEATTFARARRIGIRYAFSPGWELDDVLAAVLYCTRRPCRRIGKKKRVV